MLFPSLLNTSTQMAIIKNKDATEEVVKSDTIKMGFVTDEDQKLRLVFEQV